MNRTQGWFTALAVILGALILLGVLEEYAGIDVPRAGYGVVLTAFALWNIGYLALSWRRGVFDLFGPLLLFGRTARPVLFPALIGLLMLLMLALLWGSVRMILGG